MTEGTTPRTEEVERRRERVPRAMQGAIAEGSTPSLGTITQRFLLTLPSTRESYDGTRSAAAVDKDRINGHA